MTEPIAGQPAAEQRVVEQPVEQPVVRSGAELGAGPGPGAGPSAGPGPGPGAGPGAGNAAGGETGHPGVDAALTELARAERLPPDQQIAAYESVHRTLQDTLRTIEPS